MTRSGSVRIVSLLQQDGTLSVFPQEEPIPVPSGDQVLIRVDAAPINPADIKSLFCSALLDSFHRSSGPEPIAVTGRVPTAQLSAYRNRIGVPLPVGNEGTGIVISTGGAPAAKSLLGQRVSAAVGGMFSQYRLAHAHECIVFPPEFSPEQTAAAWINPMTALAMIDTMEREGHSAIVLTAAASSLGQMMNRLCMRAGVPIVNVVRSDQQVAVLRELGATYVCNSNDPGFEDELAEALRQTKATLAFDATGGGTLAGKILHAMEQALTHVPQGHTGYGSTTHKQLYFFGGLDPSSVNFTRNFGMAWGIGGWLLQNALTKAHPDKLQCMKHRIQRDIDSIFFTKFSRKITQDQITDPALISSYAHLKTGEKVLAIMEHSI